MVRGRSTSTLASLGLLTALLSPAVAAQTPEEIFERGNAAYQQERYADAAAAYRTLVKYRIRDPRVEFNLGNAEFKLGHVGRAILHYERARRLDPIDEDIRVNLEYVASFRLDQIDEPSEAPVLRALHSIQNRLGPERHAWITLGLVWALFAVLAWGLVKRGGWRAVHGWTLTLLVLALLACSASWYVTHQRLVGTPLAVILEEIVEVRAGPGENNPTLFTVHEGLQVVVQESRPEWVQVSLPNGLHGWVRSSSLERV